MEAIIDDLKLPVSKTWQDLILNEFEFEQYQAEAEEWKKKAEELVITDASQLKEMKLADDGRKVLQKIRTSIEKKRKELKEKSLQEGKAIDAIAKRLTSLVEPIERILEDKAKYAENLEKARIQALHEERYNEITPYLEAVPVGINYGALDNGTYQSMLHYAKGGYNERIAAEEQARVAAELAEQKRAIYNERRVQLAKYMEYGFFDLHEDTTEEEFQFYLSAGASAKKVEDDHREEQLRIAAELAAEKQRELDKINTQHQREKSLLAVEFDGSLIDLSSLSESDFTILYQHHRNKFLNKKVEQKRAEEELARIKEEEAAVLKAKEEADRAAKAAPDIDKLTQLAFALADFELPPMSTPDGKKIVGEVAELLLKISRHIDSRIAKIA